MKHATERNMKVDYYEKEEGKNVWVVESHMVEEQHDIKVTLEIDMDEMVIVEAKIEFNRYPLKECKAIEKCAAQLVGMKVDRFFSRNIMGIFMGPEGCPNVMTLLNIAVPGIMYYYYPYKVKQGEMTQNQFFEILREKEKNACLAHSIVFADEGALAGN